MTLIPATFMSAVCTAYILQAQEGFKLASGFSNITGVVVAAALFLVFLMNVGKIKTSEIQDLAAE